MENYWRPATVCRATTTGEKIYQATFPETPLRIDIPNTPWPVLNPNHRHHHLWPKRHAAVKDLAKSMMAASYSEDPADWIQQVDAGSDRPRYLWLFALIGWEAGRQLPDSDNATRMLKPVQDLIAAKLAINDNRILSGVVTSMMDPDETGWTTVLLVPSLVATEERDVLARMLGLLP